MRVIEIGLSLAFVSAVFMAQAQPPAAKPASNAPVPVKPTGTLAQVMRGIYFPNANLIFDVQ